MSGVRLGVDADLRLVRRAERDSLRQVDEVRIGDRIVFRARAHVVSGISPMSVTPAVVHLIDPETGERFEIPRDQLVLPEQDATSGDPPGNTHAG